jgi:hypothetical protein
MGRLGGAPLIWASPVRERGISPWGRSGLLDITFGRYHWVRLPDRLDVVVVAREEYHI